MSNPARNVNMSMKADGKTLVIEIDTTKDFGPSKGTGKTNIVASSNGNIDVPGVPGLKLGLNAFKK